MEIQTFAFDPRRAKSPVSILPLPKNFFPFLGQIALLWGMFEVDFDDFLGAMISAARKSVDGWKYQSFEKRRKLYKGLIEPLFASHKEIVDLLTGIIDDAASLQPRRNILLHGRIKLSVANDAPILVAERSRNGKPVREHFKLEDIEQLFFDLAHLNGRIYYTRLPWKLDISASAKSFLKDFLLSNHPSPLFEGQHTPRDQSSAG